MVGLSLCFTTVACGGSGNNQPSGTDVSVIMPISLLEYSGQTVDVPQIKKSAKKEGMKDVVENEDYSLTYIMPESKHKELLGEMDQGLPKTIQNLEASEDYPSILEITTNKEYSDFHIVVTRESFEQGYEGFGVISLVFDSLFYQLFNGATLDTYETVINLEDEATGEIFETLIYPADFSQ